MGPEEATQSSFQCDDDARETAPLDDDADGPDPKGDRRDLRTGDVVGDKFRLGAVLGTGGMGVVFEASHLALGERVAIKVLSASAGFGGERLRREARIGLRIKTEHVARVMDVGALPSGAPYLVMERLVGQNLAELLRQERRLPVGEAVDFVLQACVALAEAHAIGVVHRDLKPSNLFLTRAADGSPLIKVLDFGIAKTRVLTDETGAPLESLTLSTSILGSPQYMAPEQVRGARDVDGRADVWALGVILHELLAGQPPFTGNGPASVLAAIAADPAPRLGAVVQGVPSGLEAIVARCLEKDLTRRMPDVHAFAAALAPFAPPRSRPALERIAALGGTTSPKRSARRSTWQALGGMRAVAAVTAVGAAAAVAMGLRARSTHRDEVPRAEPPPSVSPVVASVVKEPTAEAPVAAPVPKPPATATATASSIASASAPISSAVPAPRRAPAAPTPRFHHEEVRAPVPAGEDVEAATSERH
jgi:serine/threonine-protein kinase